MVSYLIMVNNTESLLTDAAAEVNAAVAASKMERSLSTDAAEAAVSMFLLHDGDEDWKSKL